METSKEGRLLWQVLSAALLGAAIAVLVVTLIKDTPEKNSSMFFFFSVALAFGGLGAATQAKRQKSEGSGPPPG